MHKHKPLNLFPQDNPHQGYIYYNKGSRFQVNGKCKMHMTISTLDYNVFPNHERPKPYQYSTGNTKPQSYLSDRKPYQKRQNTDMAGHLIAVKNKMANTLNKEQEKISMDRYMIHLKTYTEIVQKNWTLGSYPLTGCDPKDMYFTRSEGNLLKFLNSHVLL